MGIEVNSAGVNDNASAPKNATGDERIAPKQKMDFVSLNRMMRTNTALTATAAEYVENIVHIVNTDDSGLKARIIGVHTPEVEARAIVSGNRSLLFIFAETYNCFIDDNRISVPTEAEAGLLAVLKSKAPEVKNIATYVISPMDYIRFQNMASFVINTFLTLDNAGGLTIDQLSNQRWVASGDKSRIQDFIHQHSPHEVPARDDLGILYSLVQTDSNGHDTYIPIMAMTGYTRFIANGPHARPLAIPCISNVVSSSVQHPGMALAFLPYTATHFMNTYLRPYIDEIGKPKGQNIGNLVTIQDAKGKYTRYALTDATQVQLFAHQQLDGPAVAFDLPYGRALPLDIYCVANNSAPISSNGMDTKVTQFSERVKSFFYDNGNAQWDDKIQGPLFTQNLHVLDNVTGIVEYNGTIYDTRSIDFLFMATEFNTPEIEVFKSEMAGPYDAIQALRRQYQGIKPLYHTYTTILDPKMYHEIVKVANLQVNMEGANAARMPIALDANSLTIVNQLNNQSYGSSTAIGMAGVNNWY